MEYQIIINMCDNTSNQPSKFTKGKLGWDKWWIKRNIQTNSQIKFKTTMLKSSLYNYSDAYILAKGTFTDPNTAAAGDDANNANKKVIFKIGAPFIYCISEINSTQEDNPKDIDIVMPIYYLIEYSNYYWKISRNLWQYCKDIPVVRNNGDFVELNESKATDLFDFKSKTTGQTGAKGTKNVEIMFPLKCLRHFLRTFEMPLTNSEANLILNWSGNGVMVYTDGDNHNATSAITETNIFIPLVTLSIEDNAKLWNN